MQSPADEPLAKMSAASSGRVRWTLRMLDNNSGTYTLLSD